MVTNDGHSIYCTVCLIIIVRQLIDIWYIYEMFVRLIFTVFSLITCWFKVDFLHVVLLPPLKKHMFLAQCNRCRRIWNRLVKVIDWSTPNVCDFRGPYTLTNTLVKQSLESWLEILMELSSKKLPTSSLCWLCWFLGTV